MTTAPIVSPANSHDESNRSIHAFWYSKIGVQLTEADWHALAEEKVRNGNFLIS